MKTKHLTALVMACLLMVGANVQADNYAELSATVSVECPIVLETNGSTLAFGLVAASTNGNCDLWVIPPVTGPMVNNGSGNGVSFGSPSQAHFDIFGSKPATVTVSVTDFTDQYLTLDPALITMAIGADVITPTGLDFVVPLTEDNCETLVGVSVGGSLEVCAGAATGNNHTATIHLIANY